MQYILIKFNLKSFYSKLLEKNLNKIIKQAKLMDIDTKGVISLPIRTKRFTVLRSPHIYKKAREQFEVKTHHKALVIAFDLKNEYEKKKAKLLINFVKSYCSGTQLKITYKHISI